MKVKLVSIFSIFFFSIAQMSILGYTRTTTKENVKIEITVPEKITAGGADYDASLGGLEEYLNDIENKQPSIYEKMQPILDDLKSDRVWGWTSFGIGFVGGLGLLFYGAFQFEDETTTINKGTPAELTTTNKVAAPNWGLVGAGIGVFFAGSIIGFIIAPGKSEIRKFIRTHNNLEPKDPLKLEVGYNNFSNQYYSSVQYRF